MEPTKITKGVLVLPCDAAVLLLLLNLLLSASCKWLMVSGKWQVVDGEQLKNFVNFVVVIVLTIVCCCYQHFVALVFVVRFSMECKFSARIDENDLRIPKLQTAVKCDAKAKGCALHLIWVINLVALVQLQIYTTLDYHWSQT